MQITVLGAGAWGTAIAATLATRHATCLWARDAAQASMLRERRVNARYLPGIALPAALGVTADLDAALRHAGTDDGLLLVATPMAALGGLLARMALVGCRAGVLLLCKGLDQPHGRLGHEVAREVAPHVRIGVLSGPSFAIEVARGQPTALVAASNDATLAAAAVTALHCEGLRVYTSTDPVGVEVGGAVKNVLAIATGIADGMATTAGDAAAGTSTGLGLNARAALVTRGLAEMTRLGVALGARGETFMGLSGLGDLVLTATGDLSRNRSVGRLLAQGLSLGDALARLGHVAEGVATAPMVLKRALAAGIEMPITEAVVEVLEGRCSPALAIERLMGRSSRPETA
jgi:glycerol-3-phosphate dehydrogenase (NAD(P)+)